MRDKENPLTGQGQGVEAGDGCFPVAPIIPREVGSMRKMIIAMLAVLVFSGVASAWPGDRAFPALPEFGSTPDNAHGYMLRAGWDISNIEGNAVYYAKSAHAARLEFSGSSLVDVTILYWFETSSEANKKASQVMRKVSAELGECVDLNNNSYGWTGYPNIVLHIDGRIVALNASVK